MAALNERFEGFTVASALATRATSDPEAVYIRSHSGSLTVAQVDARAEALAASLANLGIEAGERVAIILPSCPEFAVALFALAKLGAVAVPLNPRLTTHDLQYMLRHSEAVCAFTLEQGVGVDYLELFEQIMPQLPALRHLVTVGEEDLWYDDRIFQFEDLVSAGAGRDFAAPALTPEAPFAVVYTSGTSGKPKGVELSHANLLSTAAGTADAIGLVPGDRIVGVTALFHVHGLCPGLLAALLSGSSIVLSAEADAESTLEAAEAHAATVHYGIPTLFLEELDSLASRPRDLSSLRVAVVAGAPVRDELVPRLAAGMGVKVLASYSLTETSSTVSASRPGDPDDVRRFTVGRPIAGTEVRITGPAGEDLPVESVGEIRVKGGGVMLGYSRQPRETAESFDDDGYFLTGDLGLLDEDGQLHLVGRTKDVIIRSGFNVYPREVEARIESHPAVHEVGVVGVADPLLGEAICACVVPVEGAIVTGHEIVEWCRETLATEKIPDLVQFFDELPRTDTGQVRRVELSRRVHAQGQSA